jgi:hypothetical protein
VSAGCPVIKIIIKIIIIIIITTILIINIITTIINIIIIINNIISIIIIILILQHTSRSLSGGFGASPNSLQDFLLNWMNLKRGPQPRMCAHRSNFIEFSSFTRGKNIPSTQSATQFILQFFTHLIRLNIPQNPNLI